MAAIRSFHSLSISVIFPSQISSFPQGGPGPHILLINRPPRAGGATGASLNERRPVERSVQPGPTSAISPPSGEFPQSPSEESGPCFSDRLWEERDCQRPFLRATAPSPCPWSPDPEEGNPKGGAEREAETLQSDQTLQLAGRGREGRGLDARAEPGARGAGPLHVGAGPDRPEVRAPGSWAGGSSRSSPVITRKCQPKALKQNHGWELRTPRRSERLEVPWARSASSLGLGFLKRQELEVLKLWQEQRVMMGEGGCLQLAPPPGTFADLS